MLLRNVYKKEVSIIYFWDGKYWVAALREYDIMAQSDSFLQVRMEMRSLLRKRYIEGKNKYGASIPFVNIPKPEYKFPLLWRLFSIRETITFDSLERDISNYNVRDQDYNENK
ncbi:MAG: hypothetical protein NTZ20_04955 [Candidatus Levybacteria bacterium]|nr:hypothetical protein [Candidatus Levybacteria bacterium]